MFFSTPHPNTPKGRVKNALFINPALTANARPANTRQCLACKQRASGNVLPKAIAREY